MSAMIFINNKYTRIYYSIISNAQARTLPEDTYSEKHHIIPKSLGGDNSKANLVKLTAREHFICHRLLVRITEGTDKSKMLSAIWFMTNTSKNKITSRRYEKLREQISKDRSNQYAGKGNPRYGIKVADGTIQKIKQARAKQDTTHLKGRAITPEWREKIRQTLLNESNTKGIPKTEITKQRMRKPKVKSHCLHCGMLVAPHILKRWHGVNCKKA